MKNKLNHIAFIVDGNRRWAQKKGLPITAGHQFVTDTVIDKIVFYCLKKKIPYVTFWAFSTENWKRGKVFVNMLMKILEKKVKQDVSKYNKAGIRLKTIGDLSKFPPQLVKIINDRENQSIKNNKLVVTIALNYGGRDEIIRAIKKIPIKKISNLTTDSFSKYLDTSDIPDADIIIRTGGEKRLSGFMPWQSIYSELYFTNTLFPDLNQQELDIILQDFEKRDRRFGGNTNQK